MLKTLVLHRVLHILPDEIKQGQLLAWNWITRIQVAARLNGVELGGFGRVPVPVSSPDLFPKTLTLRTYTLLHD